MNTSPRAGIRRGDERFALTRHFAVASFFCTLIIAVALGWTYQHLALRDLKLQAQERNEGLVRAFANSLWPRYTPIVAASAAAPVDDLRTIAAGEGLHAAAINQMRGTQVIKIKIYGPNGVTAFSTDPRQIGENKSDNPGFMAAIAGRVASDLTHRDSVDAFEGSLNNRDVLATYLPIAGAGGQPAAVFEIYSDVTELIRHSSETRSQLIATVVGLLGLLYAFLYALVSRAQKTIDRQANTLEGYLATIEASNRALDQRVQERTESLARMNATLLHEVEERRAAESKLQLAATVFENSIEGITITDAGERILAVNRAFTQVTGYEESEVIGKTPRLLSSGLQSPEFYRKLWESLRDQGLWQGEIWNRRKNGEVFPEWLSISAVRDSQRQVSNYVAVFSDISAIKDTQAKLERLAHQDTLTGLPNRLLFTTRVTHAIAHARRESRRIAVLFLDLDHFKHVNDTLGHDVGDQLLQRVAEKLQLPLRDSDTLARLGGDEFTVLVEHAAEPRTVAQLAHRMMSVFSAPFVVGHHELFVTASVGIALFPDDGSDVATLVKHADTAMYEAKSHGRNTYHFYEPAMTVYAVDRLNTELMLRKCVANGELRVHYQPQIDLVSGELVGAEALVRWQHPTQGLLPPLKFIHIAEESGQISDIGAWVLRDACRQFSAWRQEGINPPRVAVNVSARQLERGHFAELVRDTLAEFAMPPGCLELELTESAIMGTDNAFEVLDELRRLGVELAIDDFGTGYSSLSHLKRLPISKLKIDRSFIMDIATDAQDVAIVRSVIALARTMALTTVAEGVEDYLQIDFLKQEGCSQIQGFLVSHPVDADAMAHLLRNRFGDRRPRAGLSTGTG